MALTSHTVSLPAAPSASELNKAVLPQYQSRSDLGFAQGYLLLSYPPQSQ